MEKEDLQCLRSGFVALVGRPSTGKSTLINALCGHKVAITSPKPQTTRNVIRGIVNSHNCQFVLLDTPGFSNTQDLLARTLREELRAALRRAEVILYLLDLSRPPRVLGSLGEEIEEQNLLILLREILEQEPQPICLAFAFNKADLIDSAETEKRVELYRNLVRQYFPNLQDAQCFEVSAKKKSGLEELLAYLSTCLPEGPALYEEDIYTDQEPQFRIEELIREQALSFCGRELPYALYVEVADLENRVDEGAELLWVRAFLLVERESQKGILVGKGGVRIREIRKRSTKAVRKEFGRPVHLDLQVKVDYKWRRKQQKRR